MADLYCNLEYNIEKDEFKIETNIKPELVEDFICDNVIRGQAGRGAHHSKAQEKAVYHIKITADLSYDIIRIRADTGNKSLTAGIIAHAVGRGAFKPSKLEKTAETKESKLSEKSSHNLLAGSSITVHFKSGDPSEKSARELLQNHSIHAREIPNYTPGPPPNTHSCEGD